MQGLMQNDSINLISMLIHAGRWHGEQEVVTNTVEGGIHRQTYAETMERTTRLAASLASCGIQQGDRIGTLCWNTHRHLEAWYAIFGQGAICHTINPRLFPEQIKFIINHAQDRLLFVDLTFIDLVTELLPDLPSVERVIIMTDTDNMPELESWPVETLCYESFLSAGEQRFEWPTLDDNTGSLLCYTSGTTGSPKGILYSHRSNLLHAYAVCGNQISNLAATDAILMVVPMFHANAWGLAYAAPMTGAKLVLPGPHVDGESIYKLIIDESITKAAAVATVWGMLLAYLQKVRGSLGELTKIIIGGSAVPRSIIEEFDNKYNVEVIQAWGMTETSPFGTINRPKPFFEHLSDEEKIDIRCKQGRVPYGVDIKIVNSQGKVLPHDGVSYGRLMVRGPWTIAQYFGSTDTALEDGWFDTGDIATIDKYGYLQITDRAKDIIKSGGEWISSVDVETEAVGYPGVALAACIGVSHAKWDERPILLIQTIDGEPLSEASILEHLGNTIAKWQLPDAIIFLDEIPLTATGKIDKKVLRAKYQNYLIR